MQRSEKSAGQSAAVPASKAPNRYAAPATGRPTPSAGLAPPDNTAGSDVEAGHV